MDIVINLIGVSNLENANCFQTDLHLVFGMLKYKSKKHVCKITLKKTETISVP